MKWLPLLQRPDGALMAAAVCVCVCVGAKALNLEQLVEAAGWRQTGRHVCSGLNGLSVRPR